MQQMIITICLVSRRRRITEGLTKFKSLLSILYLYHLTRKIDLLFILQGFEICFSLSIRFVSNNSLKERITTLLINI